jgi:ketosteroid isomerase-like protein
VSLPRPSTAARCVPDHGVPHSEMLQNMRLEQMLVARRGMGDTSETTMMQRYVEAWLRKDAQAALAFVADDVVLHAAGRHPLAGEFVGKQAFLDAFTKTLAALGGTVEAVAIQDLLVGPERAVALVREQATRGEQVLEFDRVNVYRLRDGQIVEIWSYDFDPYALDAFWA